MDNTLLATDKIFWKPKIRTTPSLDMLTLAKQKLFDWDVELSNRCNAQCNFCPREKLNKFGNMSLETIKLTIDKIAEVSAPGSSIGACGHGEPMLNPHVFDFITYGHAKGFDMKLTSNGWHLNFVPPAKLLDAGLKAITFSISEIDQAYTDMYKVPFDDVLKNVRQFIELSHGRCEITVNIVITEQNKGHIKKLEEFWLAEGITRIIKLRAINRGGDITCKNERYRTSAFIPQAQQIIQDNHFTNTCWAAALQPFIAWDGSYNLCSSDWRKQHFAGHISDTSWKDAIKNRLAIVNSPAAICHVCDINIQNRIVDCLESDADAVNTIIPLLIEDRKKEEDMVKAFTDFYLD